MIDDFTIQKKVEEILLKEPKYQKAEMIYQLCWRYWEIVANKGKELSALSRKGFIELNVKFGTIESIIRARRKILEKLEKKGLLDDLTRHEMALKHCQSYARS